MLRKTPLKRGGPLKKHGSTPFKKLERKLDKIFSEFIRLRDAHEFQRTHLGVEFGFVSCCTCGGVHQWRYVDAGHYIGRHSHNTRWEEQNVHAQCKGCNLDEGHKPEYEDFLREKYGADVVSQLKIAGKRVKCFTLIELEALILHYTEEVRRMNP